MAMEYCLYDGEVKRAMSHETVEHSAVNWVLLLLESKDRGIIPHLEY